MVQKIESIEKEIINNIQNVLGEVYNTAERIEGVVKGIVGVEAFQNAE
jgi:hypothetical protein